MIPLDLRQRTEDENDARAVALDAANGGHVVEDPIARIWGVVAAVLLVGLVVASLWR